MPRPRKLRILPPDSTYPTLTPAEAVLRPRTRGDCLPGGCNAERPCPWASCKHSLVLDVDPRTGRIELRADPEALDGMRDTCALDVADRGGTTLEEVGAVLGLTRERIRQVEARALRRIARGRAGRALGQFAEE